MSFATYLTRRTVLAVVAIYLVVSVTFGFVALTANPQVAQVAYQAGLQANAENADAAERERMVQQAIQEYREEHNLDEPITQRYVDYLVRVTTGDWGTSQRLEKPVTAVLARAIPATLAYVVPAMLFALLGGVLVGVFGALEPGGRLGQLVTGTAYVGFAIPNYWIATVVLLLGLLPTAGALGGSGLWSTVVLPAAILGVSLLAGQIRYARAEAREYVNMEFVKLLRAKGASKYRIARHVLRNAAIPLVSLFFADLLSVMVVNVFVLEEVIGIRGIGSVGLMAIEQRDLPLVIGIAMAIAIAGILGNLLQDVSYRFIDPRVGSAD
ncbi:MAG: ABC transporter permease [Halanaeroarchaeum sp.]